MTLLLPLATKETIDINELVAPVVMTNANIIAPFVETAKIWSDIVSRHIRQ